MSSWRPDLYSLRLFVAVCEEGSIARAAERESITPSAISRRIAEIENHARVQLLMRGGRGIRLTTAGEALLHHARHMLRISEKMSAELSEFAQGIGGRVRLSANLSSIKEFLPSDLAVFLRTYRAIRVDVVEHVSSATVEAVKGAFSDVGICVDSIDTADLQLLPYETDNLVVVVSPTHPLANRSGVEFAETLDYEFVGLIPDARIHSLLLGAAARQGRTMTFRMHVASFEVASHVIADDLAIGIFPHDAVKYLQEKFCLSFVPLKEEWARRKIILCMRDYDALTTSARMLVNHLSECGERRALQKAG